MNKTNFLIFVAALGFAVSMEAQSLITSQGAIGANDQINWGSLGPAYTVRGGSFNIASGGLLESVTVSDNTGFERLDQGNGWNGNFAPGTQLLWDWHSSVPVTMVFSSPVSAVGFQIENGTYEAFTATIQAYDTSNIYIGSVSEAGNGTGAGDNSAIFIGIQNIDIGKIIIGTTDSIPDLAIGTVYLNAQPVPEPSTLALAGLGGAGMLLGLRRRKA
jgi:hypothetical protein